MALPDQLIPGYLGFRPTGDIGPYTIYTMRNGNIVWYNRAPPKEPASYRQKILRNRWRMAAAAWQRLPDVDRKNWQQAAKKARLDITGYNLWIFYSTTQERAAIRTIERISKIQLLET